MCRPLEATQQGFLREASPTAEELLQGASFFNERSFESIIADVKQRVLSMAREGYGQYGASEGASSCKPWGTNWAIAIAAQQYYMVRDHLDENIQKEIEDYLYLCGSSRVNELLCTYSLHQENVPWLVSVCGYVLETSTTGSYDLSGWKEWVIEHQKHWNDALQLPNPAYISRPCDESLGDYNQRCIISAYWSALFCNSEEFSSPDNMKETMDWLLAQMTPVGAFPIYGDSRNAGFHLHTLLRLAAMLFGEGDYQFAAERAYTTGKLLSDIPSYTGDYCFLPPFYDPEAPLPSVPQIGCKLLEWEGIPDKVVFRDGWDYEDGYMMIDVAGKVWAHDHYDDNGITAVVWGGRPWVIENGYADPLNPERSDHADRKYHNCLLVDNKNTPVHNQDVYWGMPEDVCSVAFEDTDPVAFLHAGLENNGFWEERHYFYLKNKYITVFDHLRCLSSGNHTLSSVWHFRGHCGMTENMLTLSQIEKGEERVFSVHFPQNGWFTTEEVDDHYKIVHDKFFSVGEAASGICIVHKKEGMFNDGEGWSLFNVLYPHRNNTGPSDVEVVEVKTKSNGDAYPFALGVMVENPDGSVDICGTRFNNGVYVYNIIETDAKSFAFTWNKPNIEISYAEASYFKIRNYNTYQNIFVNGQQYDRWKIIDDDGHSYIFLNVGEAPLQDNYPPYVPNSPFPEDDTKDQPLNTNLMWSGGDPDQNDKPSYDIFFGQSNPPPMVASGFAGTKFYLDNLQYNTQYFWRIIARDTHGEETQGAIWKFSTLNKQTEDKGKNSGSGGGGSSAGSGSDECSAFSIESIEPAQSSTNAGVDVRIYGDNFILPVQVTINGLTLTTEISEDSTFLITYVPSGIPAGDYDIKVVNGDGCQVMLKGAFTVLAEEALPQIVSVDPSQGVQGRSYMLSINGKNTSFAEEKTSAVLGNGIVVNKVSVQSQTKLLIEIAIEEDAPAGTRDITIETNDTVLHLTSGFTVVKAERVPAIIALSPQEAFRGETVEVVVNGEHTNFDQSTTAEFSIDSINVDNLAVENSTTLSLTISIAQDATPEAANLTIKTGEETVVADKAFAVVLKDEETPAIVNVMPGVIKTPHWLKQAVQPMVLHTKNTHFKENDNIKAGFNTPMMRTRKIIAVNDRILFLLLDVSSSIDKGYYDIIIETDKEKITGNSMIEVR